MDPLALFARCAMGNPKACVLFTSMGAFHVMRSLGAFAESKDKPAPTHETVRCFCGMGNWSSEQALFLFVTGKASFPLPVTPSSKAGNPLPGKVQDSPPFLTLWDRVMPLGAPVCRRGVGVG
jgi:hypothetical protein